MPFTGVMFISWRGGYLSGSDWYVFTFYSLVLSFVYALVGGGAAMLKNWLDARKARKRIFPPPHML